MAGRQHEQRLLGRVAQLYYVDRLKQAEISRLLHISQASISRLLKRAEDEGIVRITVNPPRGTYLELESRLRERLGLDDVVIADCSTDREDAVNAAIGDAAAHFLETTLQDGEVIGISSWSATLRQMVDATSHIKRARAHEVIQILGGMGNPSAQVHATHLTTRLAELTGAQPVFLPAPGVAGSSAARLVLLGDGFVRSTMDRFAKVTLALVGIGGVEPSRMLTVSGNAFAEGELEDLRERGVVGDICLRFYDRDGGIVRTPLDERVISVTLEQLRQVPRVVGVAGGSRKVEAIWGAARGRHIDVLITDIGTAQALMELAAPEACGPPL